MTRRIQTARMRIGLGLLLALHGAIHLLGFASARGSARAPVLARPLSPAEGGLWLAAAVLLVASAVLLFALPRWWWVPAAAGIVLSQVLIFRAGSVAKFGTVANVILLVPVAIAALAHAPWGLAARHRAHRAALLGARPAAARPVVTEADLGRVPPPVARYLRVIGAVGRERIGNVRAVFRGDIKNTPKANWAGFAATQLNVIDPPARLFFLESTLFGVPFVAYHRYVGAAATMEVKAAHLVTVVDARGPEMNQSETVTMLNDLCVLAAPALPFVPIRWETLDERSVRATFTNAGQTISAVLLFDEAGFLVSFWSDDRYLSADGKTYARHRWSTPLRDYRDFHGRKAPAYGEATWALPDGDLTYGRFELVDLVYDVER